MKYCKSLVFITRKTRGKAVTNKKRKRKLKIISAIVILFALVGAMLLAFAGENFVIVQELFKPNVTKHEIREALSEIGIRGYLAFGILSMLQVVLTVLPAEPVQVMGLASVFCGA